MVADEQMDMAIGLEGGIVPQVSLECGRVQAPQRNAIAL
jgi:hypothetical protein